MNWIKRNNNKKKETYSISKWISWGFLFGSIVLLVYIYYYSEIISLTSISEKFYKYYSISFASVLFWGIVLCLKEEVRVNVVMVIISLLVGLYLVEVSLHFLEPSTVISEREVMSTEADAEFDTRTTLQVIQDLKEEAVDAVPSISPSLLLAQGVPYIGDVLPLGGISNKTTIGGNETGRYMIFQSDRYGFNNPDFEWNSPQVDWLLIGDSFTEGIAVQPGEGIAGQIRQITGQSVLNLGKSGNGPLSELATLKEYAEPAHPEKVFWIYYELNDLKYELPIESNFPLLMEYLQPNFSQRLISKQEDIDGMLHEYFIKEAKSKKAAEYKEEAESKKAAESKLTQKLPLILRLAYVRKRIGFDVGQLPLFKLILKEARDRVATWGGKLYFVYLPEYSRYDTFVPSHDLYNHRSKVISTIKELNIPVIDIHKEAFANHPDPLSLFPFRKNLHFNAKGYANVAKTIVTSVGKYEQDNSQK